MTPIKVQALETARRLIADILERPLEAVPLDTSIGNFPAWDSLVHVRILLAIEARTGRMLDSELISSVKSVEDIAAALDGR